MNKHSIVLCYLLTLMLAGSVAAQSSTPQVMKVQGYLTDRSGGTPVPADGLFSITFDLYDAEAGGQLIVGSGPLSVPVSEGLYEAELPFSAADFEGVPRYLELIVDGELLTPRIKIASSLARIGSPATWRLLINVMT